jgi:XRE family aerobic/anaerobic benzoate catabolism transcriptional regulator
MPDALPESKPRNSTAENSGTGRKRAPCAAVVHQDYLRLLGERVKATRARRGMTRKILARDSGVSERYLAQLESGRGNISIALLRQVATAMSLPLADLVWDGEDRPIELGLLIQRLERLAPEDLAEASRMLAERFGASSELYRSSRVALIGLRGAGKTTLGRALSQALGAPFIEMAKEIETTSGMSLDKIFDLSGQAGYRRYERRALEAALDTKETFVVATGGSMVSEAETYELLLENCFTVWLRTSPEEHMARVVAQGDMRPIAGNREAMEDLRRMLKERDALYGRADAILDTSGKTEGASLADLVDLVHQNSAETAVIAAQ